MASGSKKSAYATRMTGIRNRTEAKDVFYTPHAIAEKMVEMADIRTGDRVLEGRQSDVVKVQKLLGQHLQLFISHHQNPP